MEKMKQLFDYFESADEAVYVSDVETYDLIYMNRQLKKILGYPMDLSCEGMKCYKVLQNEDKPCAFCNNQELLAGDFKTWVHENPVVDHRFLIKDKAVECEGRHYRVEVATEMSKAVLDAAKRYFTQQEKVLNDCQQFLLEASDPDKAFGNLLQYLGESFGASRTYIFEISENGLSAANTYEWCDDTTASQMEILSHVPLSDIGYGIDAFKREDVLSIHDIETIRENYPNAYFWLKEYGINSLIAGPIREDGQLKGFIGIDNPKKKFIFLLEQVLKNLGECMMTQFKRRNLYNRFNRTSYHDMLTGAYNHSAMLEHSKMNEQMKAFGVVYCDINDLKETNKAQGLDRGNELIRECYRLMQKKLHTEWIYRVGGDEFAALYYNADKRTVEKDVEALRMAVLQSICQMAIGYAWSDEQPIDAEKVLDRAEAEMRREKNMYYALVEADKEEKAPALPESYEMNEEDADSCQIVLRRFLSNAYCDMAFLLTVLGDSNRTSYFFFGDMQQSVYYVSENMRRKFGFASNIVSDLIHVWASRIEDPDLLERFWKDINALLTKKQTTHDLRYQVYDASENKIWIRCYAQIKWSDDGKTPLFFVGRITQQDEDFVVDPLTNFPTEAVLIKKINKIRSAKQKYQAIGFSLHNITQINNNHGRHYGDELVYEISSKLSNQFAYQVNFYRMSGMRFLGLIEGRSDERAEEVISQIREIVDRVYANMGIRLPSTCSFVVLRTLMDVGTPQDFVENALALIKEAHQSPKQVFVDDTIGNIKKIKKIKQAASMESSLIANVLNNMENFRIVIQPVVSSETGQPRGGEVLLRWKFNGENISPAVFIPIIERENMTRKVGRWVLEQAAQACASIVGQRPEFYVTVNVSLQQLDDEGFIAFIKKTLDRYGLEGKHIVLELTESCMDTQPEKLEQFVQECMKLSIRIALDDFGSGYSSMRVLLRYPSSIIKLDRSLLLEMGDSTEKNDFITSIVCACHRVGKKVCMEGVETEEQNELVKESGCDLIQGFYYYRPMELDAFYHLAVEKCDGKE